MVDPLRVRVTGALAPFAEGFVVAVAEAGYPPNGGAKQVQLLAHLSRWLGTEGLGPADLDGEVIARFFAARRAAGYRERLTPRSGEVLFAYLRGLGVVPMASAPSAPQGPTEELLARFERYLLLERGLLADTAADYVHSVRPFLEGFADADHVDVSRLDGPAVVAFVIERCPRQTRSSAKRTVKALRSVLGFLHAEGYIERSLMHAVPAAGGWRLAALPKRLEPDQVRRLLAACDRRSMTGCRDFAVLTVLARLGLRAGEVAGLSLDDIDWRAGEVVVHGKARRSERLPLPADVGEAMVAYLQDGRPASALGRTLFVRVRAPHRTLTNKAVSAIVLRAATRAGLGRIGPHQLRHTVASEMLAAGASLPEIGQVLRHQHPETTAIYAKVDREALRRLARPWPEAAR
jgi:site-specific recombinase XerD